MTNQLTKKVSMYIGAMISMVIVGLALWVMYHTLQEIRFDDVVQHLKDLSFGSIVMALAITAASYLIVTGYDVVALIHIRRRVPYPVAAFSAFLASTFGNNIGFAILTGTSIRYRVYSQIGLSALDIAGVSSMCALTTMFGMSSIFGIAMLLQVGDTAQTGLPFPPEFMRLAGGIVLGVLLGYITYTAFKPLTFRTKNWSLRMPSAQIAMAQIFLATSNLTLVASLIYILLPADIETGYIAFLSVFALALIAGSASNVPGGIGVFESVILVGLPEIPTAALLGSILLFRCIYYLTPLAIASLLLAVQEGAKQRDRIDKLHESTLDLLDQVGPQLMAMIIMYAGVLLLFSGSIPAGFNRAESHTFVPLPIIELSHLLGAAAGIGMLIAARGIAQRLTSSFDIVIRLLFLGIVTSLLKGFGYREALGLGLILALLWRTKPEFYRRANLFDEGLPAEWATLVSIILAVTIWLGLFAFKDVIYTTDLWWTFDIESDFPRFLRSTLMVFAVAGTVIFNYLLKPDPLPSLPEAEVLGRVRQILKEEQNPRANLVLLGDKRIRFSESGKAFIMYQVRGKSWVVLGDPVGPKEERAELIMRFRNLCDRYGAWPVFYLVDEENLPLYTQLALSIDHIGDDALMPLDDFSLKSPIRTELREVYSRVKKQGANLEIVESNKVSLLLPQLKEVSDSWLEATGSRESGFARSLFDPYYVINFPCAVVRSKKQIVAFALLWPSPNKDELMMDLVRYHRDAPKNIVDFMIIDVLQRGRDLGYRWLNLGTAPITGLDNHPLTPIWNRVGVLMYHQSEKIGDILNIRDHDAQYNPSWRPKYIVSPSSDKLPRIFNDIAKLISDPRRPYRENHKNLIG